MRRSMLSIALILATLGPMTACLSSPTSLQSQPPRAAVVAPPVVALGVGASTDTVFTPAEVAQLQQALEIGARCAGELGSCQTQAAQDLEALRSANRSTLVQWVCSAVAIALGVGFGVGVGVGVYVSR